MQDNEAKLWDRATAAFEKDDFQQAVSALDSILERYSKSETDEPKIRLGVARALVNKGIALGSLDRGEDEIAVYDEVIRRFGNAEELPFREEVARALVNKGITLRSLGRGEDEITVYDEVIRRFGDAEELPLREQVARALVNKGAALGGLGRGEDAIAVFDEVIRRFGDAEGLPLREQVARALVNKGVALRSLDRGEDAIAVYDEVIRRFGDAEELLLREDVARTLVNKGVALGTLGRWEDAIVVFEEVIRRFGDAEEITLREQVANALNGKAWRVYLIGDFLEVDKAIVSVEKSISIMPQSMAFHHTLACLLGLAFRWEEAFEHAKRFSDDPDMVEKCSQDILAFFVDAAATGQAEPALLAIEGTKSEPAMEPLVVALKMSAGKPYRAPREVVEMANDIQRKILQRTEVLHRRMVK
jgi:tetratricopeptide (TPR) repeat protein